MLGRVGVREWGCWGGLPHEGWSGDVHLMLEGEEARFVDCCVCRWFISVSCRIQLGHPTQFGMPRKIQGQLII